MARDRGKIVGGKGKQNEQSPREKTAPGILESHKLASPGSSQVFH